VLSGGCAFECYPTAYECADDALHRSNENKMSDGGRGRPSLGVEVWKSSQKWERTAVRRSLHRMVRPWVCHGENFE
jgi:hypothetical protein